MRLTSPDQKSSQAVLSNGRLEYRKKKSTDTEY